MPTPVSMCLFNPKPKQSQSVNRLRASHRAPQRASQRAPVPSGAVNLRSNTRNKMNLPDLKNKKPCGRCGGAK